MARRRYLLLTGLGLCLSARGLAAEGAGVARVSLADVGGAPGGGDAAAVFQAALARLPRRGGAVLHVPPGTWRFAATDGNAVLLDDFEALTIEGAGATLVFSGHCKPFVFSRCHRPVVRGLSIDWQRPPFSQGQVIRVGDGRLDADVSIDTGFAVDGSEPVSALGTYDRATGLMARGGLDAYDVVDHVALAASQTLRLAFKRPVPLQVGNTLVLRHAIYAANAFTFERCQDVLLENVTVHSAPGMAVYADHCTGVTVTGLRIEPPPGSTRLMTTTADGVHCNACSGDILIQDCVMTRMGDDCVNVHGKYYRISQRSDPRTATVAAPPRNLASPQHDTPAGEAMDFVAPDTLGTIDTQTATSAEAVAPGSTVLHFDHDLPPQAAVGSYVYDAAARAQVSILRCVFPGNRARGVLAHRDTRIEGCTFHGQSAEAVLLLPDLRFMEGPAAGNVKITNNDFADVLRLVGRGGAIRIDVGGRAPETRPVLINRDITIAGNRFAAFAGAAVVARSVTGLVVADNQFAQLGTPVIALQDVVGARVVRNSCDPAGVVAVAPADRPQLVMEANRGLAASV